MSELKRKCTEWAALQLQIEDIQNQIRPLNKKKRDLSVQCKAMSEPIARELSSRNAESAVITLPNGGQRTIRVKKSVKKVKLDKKCLTSRIGAYCKSRPSLKDIASNPQVLDEMIKFVVDEREGETKFDVAFVKVKKPVEDTVAAEAEADNFEENDYDEDEDEFQGDDPEDE